MDLIYTAPSPPTTHIHNSQFSLDNTSRQSDTCNAITPKHYFSPIFHKNAHFFFYTTTYNIQPTHTSHNEKKHTKQPTKKLHQQRTLSTILEIQAPRHYTAALLTAYILPEHTLGKRLPVAVTE